jgi:DNA-binding NtrC family response regulator
MGCARGYAMGPKQRRVLSEAAKRRCRGLRARTGTAPGDQLRRGDLGLIGRIAAALAAHRGDVPAAARALAVSRETLYRWLRGHPELRALREAVRDAGGALGDMYR